MAIQAILVMANKARSTQPAEACHNHRAPRHYDEIAPSLG